MSTSENNNILELCRLTILSTLGRKQISLIYLRLSWYRPDTIPK